MTNEHDSLVEAMGHREVISTAVRLLRAKHDVGEAAAFGMLIHGPSESQDDIREVAAGVVRESARLDHSR